MAATIVLLVSVPAAPVLADPAGPTDYRSEVASIEPPAPGIHVEMIGGDSFLQITVDPGTALDVIGYRGEPYLRFEPDGTVEINDNAPSTYLSEDRYGETAVPDSATPDAEPDWRVVGTDGVYAWHDHRSHWMNESRPAAEPGDQILEAVVPVVVDGVDTDVTIISTWVRAPSPLPAAAGALIGALIAFSLGRNDGRTAKLVLAFLAVAASVVSVWAYTSVPPETAPSYVPVVGAVAALGLTGYGLLRSHVDQTIAVMAPALILAGWGFIRRAWLTRAILPTSIPTTDRFVTALVLVAATIIVLAGVSRLARLNRV